MVWFTVEIIQSRVFLQIASVILAVVLITATSRQLGYWQNTRTLFEHASQVTPNNYMAITMLGSLLARNINTMRRWRIIGRPCIISPLFPKPIFLWGLRWMNRETG